MKTQNKINKIRSPIVTVAGHVDHGKCVSGDTLIHLIDGSIITAKEIFEENFDKKIAERLEDGIVQTIENKNLFVSSFDKGKIKNKKISHIWRKKADRLVEIKTASGDIIKTTPEHPFFIFNLGDLITKRADLISEKEYIAIPTKIISKDSKNIKKIIIKKLKETKNLVAFLNSESIILFNKLKNQNINILERKLKIKNLRDSIKNKRFRIRDLFLLTNQLKISENKTYLMIDKIKNSNEKQRAGHTSKIISLPNLKKPKKLGYILGCLAGDGHIPKTGVQLCNNDLEIQQTYQDYLKQVFNLDSIIKQGHTCKIVKDNGGLTFVRFLTEIVGFPKTNKTATISVPEIVKRNKELFKGFFAGLLDTDGYVSHINNSIEITSKSKILLKECSILLLNFKIHSVIYKKNGFYNLRIANKIYLIKFLKTFNLMLKRKLDRIIKACKKAQTSRIFDFLPLNGRILKDLKVSRKINKKIPYFNKYIQQKKLSATFLKIVLKNLKQENETSKKIRYLLKKDISFVQVISKKEIKNKDRYVYDFTIPKTHNFVAERVLIHNTTILDSIRKTNVYDTEAGGITQKISFTKVPLENIKKICPLIEKNNIELDFPGFLFIDTPGHAAFSHLRKRGGSLADLAILVIDINDGIKPQTQEVIKILKLNKIPFIVALNKIDNISGWRKQSENIKENIDSQSVNTKLSFDEKLYTIIGSLHHHGFNAKPFYEITDFTKQIALIPCSGKTGQGIPELIFTLAGLSQKFLKENLKLGQEAKGVILEIKKEKSMQYAEAILYDGIIDSSDEIAIASFNEPIISKIRVLEEIQPISNKFKPVKNAIAATGIRLQLINSEEILPGMPFTIFKNNLEEIKKEFEKDLGEKLKTNEKGIIIKADSLGSLEALITMLKQERIPIIKAGIGKINKKDIISAQTNLREDPLNAIILGFNIGEDEEVKEIVKDKKEINIIKNEVIYKLIEDLLKFRDEKEKEIKKQKLMELASVCKLTILHQYVFRNSNPAVFGVKIEAGTLKPNIGLIDENGNEIAKVRDIQENQKKIAEASKGMEIAISLPGTNFERQLININELYSNLTENQFRKFKENKELLSSDETQTLQRIAQIKRAKNTTWGV